MDQNNVKSIRVGDSILLDVCNLKSGGFSVRMRDILIQSEVTFWQCEFLEILNQLENMLKPDIHHPILMREHDYQVKTALSPTDFIITKQKGSYRFRLEHASTCMLIDLRNEIFGSQSQYVNHNCS